MTTTSRAAVFWLIGVAGCAATSGETGTPDPDAGAGGATGSGGGGAGGKSDTGPADAAKPSTGGAGGGGGGTDARPPVTPTDKVMAFPGAEGFGADTPGGRGGKIYEVTNLNDDGDGSFRKGMTMIGKRIIVFRTSGTITLKSDISIGPSMLTVAGQTSPGGIQIKGPTHGLGISGSHDIVIRHLRIRPGGTADMSYNTNAAILISGASKNIVIDHCSLQWQNHHILETYNAGENITYQWNIVGEGSATPYGFSMSMTGSANGNIRTFSVHHNLILHSVGSNPMVGATKYYDFRNNVIYNWVGDSVLTAGSPGNTSILNFVNNHYIAGPNSGAPAHYLRNGDASADRGGTKIFTEGNWSPKCPTGCANDWDNNFRDWDFDGTPAADEAKYRVKTPFPVPAVTTLPTKDVKDTVLSFVGADKPVRDSLDARLVNDVKTGKGYEPAKVGFGPWPTLEDLPAPEDKDHDGMADAWEMAHGLNPGDPADGPAVAKNGYTNVENYLNELAGDPVP